MSFINPEEKRGTIEFKSISAQDKNNIIVRENQELDKIELALFSSTILSDFDKYEIITDLQNRFSQRVEAEIYIHERKLNLKK